MKITNFRLTKRTGTDALTWKFKGVVTVETGILFKTKIDREVYREYLGSWCFVDNGEFTPGLDVENSVRKYEAERMEKIESVTINKYKT